MNKLRIQHNTASDEDCYCLNILEEGNVHPIAYMQAVSEEFGGGGNSEVLSQAHTIIRAVNSLPALVSALENSNNALKLFADKSKIIRAAIDANNAALALAKGE